MKWTRRVKHRSCGSADSAADECHPGNLLFGARPRNRCWPSQGEGERRLSSAAAQSENCSHHSEQSSAWLRDARVIIEDDAKSLSLPKESAAPTLGRALACPRSTRKDHLPGNHSGRPGKKPPQPPVLSSPQNESDRETVRPAVRSFASRNLKSPPPAGSRLPRGPFPPGASKDNARSSMRRR